MTAAKPFIISKHLVVDAFLGVKANAGSAGVDGVSIEEFERNLQDNLYKIWNRMSSGTYFPPPVKEVAIPKKSGGERILGVPTVSDRVAQMVVKRTFEPIVEPGAGHPDIGVEDVEEKVVESAGGPDADEKQEGFLPSWEVCDQLEETLEDDGNHSLKSHRPC